MLTIKCSRCKTKIIKYKKIGMGKVIKCYKDRITKYYKGEIRDERLVCSKCENQLGSDEGEFIKMNQSEFTYTGTKIK